ncbi:MAG: TPM domain-containing protein [Thermoleophilia bacterium]|nr:TPM domain-containing protein [Thermoleophilia bacterium]
MSVLRSRGGVFAAAALVAAFLIVLLGGAPLPSQALAESPFRVASQIEDHVGAVQGRETEVQSALDKLESNERVQLWVVFVDTFSGMRAQDWADETAIESDLGLNDVLLAVATEDRSYAYSVDQDFELADDELDEVMLEDVEPALRQNDWAGAAVGAATGMQRVLSGQVVTTATTGSGGGVLTTVTVPSTAGGGAGEVDDGFPWGVVIGLIVLALIVVFVVLLSRRSRKSGVQGAAPGTGSPAPMTLEELRRRVGAELVQTDDALKTSIEELGFAIAEFGEEEAAPFQKAVDTARAQISEAFKIYREFDEKADEQTQRHILNAVLERTTAANSELDTQVEHFDRLRDLEKQAPQVLAKLETDLASLEARVPRVREELARLASIYSPAALAAVASNPDEASSRLEFSREEVKAGLEDLAADRVGEAAVAALAAQEAAGQAQALLDAVGRLGRELEEAQKRIDAAVAETRQDIAEAHAAGVEGQLAALIGTAETAVAATVASAGPDGGRDPLAALRHLEEADAALEAALQQVRDEQAQRAKAAMALDRTLVAARTQVAATADYITTHRGAVGGGPRARLAEAQSHLDQAIALSASDPVTALRYAANAHELASRALGEAQVDMQQATTSAGAPGMDLGSSVIGAILGGILAGGLGRGSSGGSVFGSGGSSGGSIFGGSRPGGRTSGGGRFGGSSNRSFGGGGFSPPSFGGTGTRMRRGGGGRF